MGGSTVARAALYGFCRGEGVSDVSDPFLVLLHFEHGRFEHGERGGAEFDRHSRRASDHFIFQARVSGTLRLTFWPLFDAEEMTLSCLAMLWP